MIFRNYGEYRKRYGRLVELEREEEMRAHENEIRNMSPGERESKGRALLGLRGRDQGTGLGGSHIVKYVRGGALPETEISVGDLVLISRGNPLLKENPTGTVYGKTGYSVTVAFDRKPPRLAYGRGLRMDLYVNDITFQRMKDALGRMEKAKGRKAGIRDILLGKRKPGFSKPPEIGMEDDTLDPSQRRAVSMSVGAEDMFLVHGPPGTGKTTTLIEIILQHVKTGKKVLATAASNVAVDNMVDFITRRGRKAVRVGHPARITRSLVHHSLDFLVQDAEKYREAGKLREEADRISEKRDEHEYPSQRWRRGLSNEEIMELANNGKGSRGVPPERIRKMAEWAGLQKRMGELIEKAKKLEDEAVNEIIDKAEVICTTNSTAGSELLEGRDFDVIVIDEATQATEPSCLIPMNHGSKVIMAGDHKQLPPTIMNQEAKRGGLEETLFERMIEVHGEEIKIMLETQYRMNGVIMDFPGRHFYGGGLLAADSVRDHTLDIKGKGPLDPDKPVVFLDTKGSCPERRRTGSKSRENPGESDIVRKLVRQLLELGVKPGDIGVISPYDDQIDLMKRGLPEDVETKTVDGFQGREKEVILVSFVRSNKKGSIGFLEDLRRLNVSITRARKKLIMVGDSRTLNHHRTYRELISYSKEKCGYMEAGGI